MFCDLNNYFSSLYNSTLSTFDFIGSQLDLLYLRWVLSLIYPTFLAIIILPFVIVAFLYLSSFVLYLYYHRHYVLNVLQETIESRDPWVGGRYIVSILWDAHGYIWHGYEIKGLENLPQKGGCILVYYHGALPVDIYYFTSRVIIQTGRFIHNIGDRFLFKIPGWKALLDAYQIKPGTVSSCIEVVKEGHMLAISPGGVREAQFSDNRYEIMWGKRTGFAKVALETNCLIIPVFTENLREAFRTFCWPLKFWIYLYERVKLPFAPVYGGFPVKLRTHVGKPIMPMMNETPEQLASRVRNSLRELIDNHQRLPGNILMSLLARFYEPKPKILNKNT